MPIKDAPFISQQVVSGEYYFLNLRPDAKEPGTVVCGGYEQCDPHYRIARNRFKFHSIEYVAAGQGVLTVNGKSFPLRPGSIFYYSPKTRHEITTDPADPLAKYFIDFCGPRFTRLLKEHPLASHEPRYFSPAPRVHDLFASLQQNGRNPSTHAPGICACLLELLILQVAGHALSHDDAQSPAHLTYERCHQLIEKRFLELHTLADITAACHINPPYLCRLFKRFGAEPPYQMLIRLKMRHATDLLNAAGTLIKQVAKATGFSDPYHFSRLFKKVYGVSPRLFIQSTQRVLQ